MYFFRDFKDIVRMLTEVLGMFRRLAEQDGRQKETDGGRVLPSSEKRRIATGVQAFFEKNYDLRYNVMKQTEEFRRKAPPGNSKALIGEGKALIAEEVALIRNYDALIENPDGLVDGWRQLTDREFNRIVVEQMQQEGAGWAVDIQRVLAQELKAADVPSITKLTEALRNCRFPHGKIRGVRGWYARRLSGDECI